MQCTNCGATNRQGAKFCNRCGARIEVNQPMSQVPPPVVNQPAPQVQQNKLKLLEILNDFKYLILIYVIFLLCCGSSALLLGFRTNWILWKLGLR
jgi:uncharacterized membrane protein YvbJ